MKSLFIFCAVCCFIAILKMPIAYYTLLRIIISLGSVLAIYQLIKHKNYPWLMAFVLVFILFNPMFPIYLYKKSIWMPLDILVGILFLLLAWIKKEMPVDEKIALPFKTKVYKRDHIILPKNTIKKEN